MSDSEDARRPYDEKKSGTEQRLMPYASFDDILAALPVILPAIIAIGLAAKWLINRHDKAHEDELKAARDSRMVEREEMS